MDLEKTPPLSDLQIHNFRGFVESGGGDGRTLEDKIAKWVFIPYQMLKFFDSHKFRGQDPHESGYQMLSIVYKTQVFLEGFKILNFLNVLDFLSFLRPKGEGKLVLDGRYVSAVVISTRLGLLCPSFR